ncbi:Syntaxin-10 [Psilocybe cubensis]|uniref:Syntaxin-10 n=2 Tax=Psilocybe cubensis TaxID=181762 RepID=A0ACB8GK32_PSICU|nr:Syntaxin-10 [Psilocybe cubensis]KAH9475959.1 Syntaxin-10 [Psilocybe cubensis]
MSLAKLTAVSTKTLSLLLERQRLQTLPIDGANASANGSSLHYPQIKRNLAQLREGIHAMESKDGPSSEAAKLLRNQYDRMRGMLWEEERAEIPSLDNERSSPSPPLPEPIKPPPFTHTNARDSLLSHPTFAPYTDDPEQGQSTEPPDAGTMLHTQRFIMQEQDQQLDQLSHSINRQHHISLQINEELDVHHGLLQDLDTEIDRTQGRLGKARKKLDHVAQGIKENGSVVAIGVLIFILLILIIRFKT